MKLKLTIGGMTCEHCAGRVKKALEAVNGVSGVKIKLKEKLAVLEADASVTNELLKSAVEDAGYELTGVN